MTGARRWQRAWGAGAFALLLMLSCATLLRAQTATNERIVIDPLSGLAIGGFDPVAYFTDRVPRLGDGSLEYAYAGTVWRFCNEGNRAAFVAHPQVYMPRFGGYDPVGLSRGVAVAGTPWLWLIAGERLYLFSKPADRASFAADPEQTLAAAEVGWSDIETTLVR